MEGRECGLQGKTHSYCYRFHLGLSDLRPVARQGAIFFIKNKIRADWSGSWYREEATDGKYSVLYQRPQAVLNAAHDQFN
jgi:hypothetical protein